MDNNKLVKQLTGKDRNDYEAAAAHLINNADCDAFFALVEKSDFLFDFIKENVKKRLQNAINEENYKNLLKFLTVYSYDYEELIVSNLVSRADEDLTDLMLEKLENGLEDEKIYAAGYFSFVNDTLAVEFLQEYAFSDSEALAANCAKALAKMGEKKSFDLALEKLKSEDDFEKLSAVKFLVAYGDAQALPNIFEAMKTSAVSEYIAAEIPYLKSFFELLNTEFKNDTLFALSQILHGLGEIIPLSQVFDFEFYEIINQTFVSQIDAPDSKVAVLLLQAREKFNQLTENDEYIFDESKEIKAEIHELKNLLNSQSDEFWVAQKELMIEELDENSAFVFTALDLIVGLASPTYGDDNIKLQSELNLKPESSLGLPAQQQGLNTLLVSSNQTLILKTVEVLKSLNKLQEVDKITVLSKISDENIKAIIESLF